jgi:hypothetical protein
MVSVLRKKEEKSWLMGGVKGVSSCAHLHFHFHSHFLAMGNPNKKTCCTIGALQLATCEANLPQGSQPISVKP